jgi:hypothetical protein
MMLCALLCGCAETVGLPQRGGTAQPLAVAAAEPESTETVILPPGYEVVRSRSSASSSLSFGPVIAALGIEAAPPAGSAAAVEERWVCAPSGAGMVPSCETVTVTRSVAS